MGHGTDAGVSGITQHAARLQQRRATQRTRAARKFFQSPSLVVKRGRDAARTINQDGAVPSNGGNFRQTFLNGIQFPHHAPRQPWSYPSMVKFPIIGSGTDARRADD
jgi:hypothetical protein